MGGRRRVLIAAFAILSLWPSGATAADWQAPYDFFGIGAWRQPTGDELRTVSRAGVTGLRAGINRAWVLGPDGSRNWREYDEMVGDSARAGIEILPILVDSPRVGRKYRPRAPVTPAARARFAAWVEEVVERYGPLGSFWRDHPRLPYLPFTAYQVWNEPNLRAHWKRPDARRYVQLLRTVGGTIRGYDPDATIVAGGIPDTVRGIRMRPYLRRFYRQPGVRRLFDVLAIHPYARQVYEVEDLITMVRGVMRRHGDGRTPIWITEIGWASGGPSSGRFRVGVRGQADRLREAFELFLEERRLWRIERIYWFSLQDRDLNSYENDWWGPHTGLFYVSGFAKPAWRELADLAGGTPDTWLGRPLPSEPEEEEPCTLGVFCDGGGNNSTPAPTASGDSGTR